MFFIVVINASSYLQEKKYLLSKINDEMSNIMENVALDHKRRDCLITENFLLILKYIIAAEFAIKSSKQKSTELKNRFNKLSKISLSINIRKYLNQDHLLDPIEYSYFKRFFKELQNYYGNISLNNLNPNDKEFLDNFASDLSEFFIYNLESKDIIVDKCVSIEQALKSIEKKIHKRDIKD
ncbi:hypothetical protein H311_04458, partial [Anncaliia algerae PRA109]